MSRVALPKDLAWVPALVSATYFTPCPNHGVSGAGGGAVAKADLTNLFRLSTRQSLCSTCAAQCAPEDVVQIRRSSYHNVVRVQDVCKMMDVSGIQTYVINSARVVFLSERPRPRGKGSGGKEQGSVAAKPRHNACHNCSRMLQADASLYCSIACKVSAGVNMVPPADGTSGGVEASGGEGVKKERGGATAGKVAPLSRGTGRLSKQDQQLGSVTSEAVDSVGRGRGGRGERVGNGQTPVKAEEHEGDNSPEVTPRTRGVKRSAASGPVTPGLQGRLPAPLVGSSSGKKSRNGSGSEGGSEGRGGRLAGVGVDSASLRLLQMGNRRKGHPRKSPDC